MTAREQAQFDDYGVRFSYPASWQTDVTEEGSVTTISLQADSGPAFALVTLDDSCPDPDEVADQALAVMREEYPSLDSSPTSATIAGQPAVGHDVEFFALDVTNGCAIRCFRTPRRTILLFGQWSDLESDEAMTALDAITGSIVETDAGA